MKHMEKYWIDELNQMRQCLLVGEGIELTSHAATRLSERNIDPIELGVVLMTGEIYESYDIGEYVYKGKPNRHPVRLVIGKSQSKVLSFVVAIDSPSTFAVVTVYEGVVARKKADIDNFR
ncbi:DUF4258 domain-containing protein [Anaerobacillus isosaccharinicus]|uniref:DUF4258 domain-containing protein n=1 Tax=Anaerobacillus isosaccharinicus TaxID=1532552 RepID=A0A1S2L3P2_9BACI|nr:DUF4258 domain-containing protein [Anaerobacillus isosaccharinicus]MBA5588270.1 DUF4258 domain-containing protein [Anaerobacillus isosaccharinicus]QOY38288.1 DUF4258 domain-containing protein [Anaerobacillus isosaccharinicus]